MTPVPLGGYRSPPAEVVDFDRSFTDMLKYLDAAWTPGGALDAVALEEFAADTLVGTVEQCADRLGAFAASGVEEVIVCPASLPFAVYDWSALELIGERLVPAAHSIEA